MDLDESLLQRIAFYLDDKMTTEERRSFEALVRKTPELEKELLLSKKLHHHFENGYQEDTIPLNEYTKKLRTELSSDDAKKIKGTIREIGLEYEKEKRNSNSFFRPWMFAAAAAIVLFFAVNYFLDTSNEALYANYYNNDDVPSLIQRDAEQTLLTQGVAAFYDNDNTEAIRLFEKYETQNTIKNDAYYIIKGTSYSKIGDLNNAIKAYDTFIASASLDRSKGIWFKALAYLKADMPNESKTTLLLIKEKDFNYKEAQELLDKL